MAYEVFISYSHKDQKLREELDTHLGNLKRQNIITSWYDGNIKPGEELQPQIIEHLNKAQIILLLVSANSIASDFCFSTEMKQPIARHDANKARLIPILLRPTVWKGAPFAKFKMLPTDAKAITLWPSPTCSTCLKNRNRNSISSLRQSNAGSRITPTGCSS